MTIIQFEEHYANYLNQEMQRLKQLAATYKDEARDDEAKFAQIEFNVVDIFSKMFSLSVKTAQASPDWKTALNTAYTAYFNKIPASWKERLSQCEVHQLHEEAHIERIKLEQASRLLKTFEENLNQLN